MRWKIIAVLELIALLAGAALYHPQKTLPTRNAILEAMPVNPDAVVMLGDSITARCPQWHGLLGNVNVENWAASGSTTADVLARINTIATRRPKTICLMIGINDIQFGKGGAADRIAQIVSRIRRESPDTRIVLQSVLPVNSALYRQPRLHRPTPTEVSALNTGIRQFAEAAGVEYLDLSGLTENAELAARYTSDGLHLNGAGYLAWATILKPVLETDRYH